MMILVFKDLGEITAVMPRARYAQNKNYYVALGRQIATIRHSKMTQEDLARTISLTRTSVINIEKGRQQLLVHTLVDIARALGVPVTELLPPPGDVAHALRDASKKGREWVLSSAVKASKDRQE
jgi:DNA-binding XRE family transcriptional regulator